MTKQILIQETIPAHHNAPEHFWNAVNLLIFNQHVVNRRLSGIENRICLKFKLYANYELKLSQYDSENIVDKFTELMKAKLIEFDVIESDEVELLLDENEDDAIHVVIVQKLLPRNLDKFGFCTILCHINFQTNSLTYHSCGETNLFPSYDFTIKLNERQLLIEIDTEITDECGWLKSILFKKFKKWMDNISPNGAESNAFKIKSLSLICIEEYTKLYNQIKDKHGKEMVKIWPENTDPLKYVYEDIAIATYLILLWRKYNHENVNFVDLGCGNGLLVYILTQEGFSGYGIDLRKRKIWDLYPSNVRLEIETINPLNNVDKYQNINWIIGNHSDELSPWIPVIAARNYFNCNYFLLPCCSYEFNGSKYQRSNMRHSQYHDFLEYTLRISDVCGFKTKVDRLKIPSTKRICLIGDSRVYGQDEYEEYLEKIKNFVSERCQSSTTYKTRDVMEKIKNCTKINKEVIRDVVEIVFKRLLVKKNFCERYPNWNCGTQLKIGDLIADIEKDMLKELKSECGGLQTLLKNHSQIFHVFQGKVKIRLPETLNEKREANQKKNRKEFVYKQKMCWFYLNHPDGCPFNEDDCSFKHKE